MGTLWALLPYSFKVVSEASIRLDKYSYVRSAGGGKAWTCAENLFFRSGYRLIREYACNSAKHRDESLPGLLSLFPFLYNRQKISYKSLHTQPPNFNFLNHLAMDQRKEEVTRRPLYGKLNSMRHVYAQQANPT